MTTPPTPANADGAMDVNAIVSYNLRAIRRQRGMTQDDVADGLAGLTGHRLPQASISAMERGVDSTRSRRFDAHELYLVATVFRVPIAYFFLPPAREPPAPCRHRPPCPGPLHSVLGTEHQLDDVIDRLAAPNAVDPADDGFLDPETWLETFLTWREQRIAELASDPLDGRRPAPDRRPHRRPPGRAVHVLSRAPRGRHPMTGPPNYLDPDDPAPDQVAESLSGWHTLRLEAVWETLTRTDIDFAWDHNDQLVFHAPDRPAITAVLDLFRDAPLHDIDEVLDRYWAAADAEEQGV